MVQAPSDLHVAAASNAPLEARWVAAQCFLCSPGEGPRHAANQRSL